MMQKKSMSPEANAEYPAARICRRQLCCKALFPPAQRRSQMRDAFLLDKLGCRFPQMITVIEGLERLAGPCRQRCDERVGARLIERWNRIALAPGPQHSMDRRPDGP